MRVWRLGANISNDPAQAAADCALLASLGGVVVRTSQEQSGAGPAAQLGPYRKACDDHGLELFQTCQPVGHVVPKTQAGLDAFGMNVAESASIADRTSSGNEVNGFGSDEIPNPKGQSEMMLAAIEATAKYAPGRRLATPSMCPAAGALGSAYVDPLIFFDAMVAAEPKILHGGIEVDWHGYSSFTQPPGTPATWNTCYRTRALHTDLVKLGHPKMKISWSEFAEPSGGTAGVSPTQQSEYFDLYLAEAASQRAAGVVLGELIWYQLRDQARPVPGNWTNFAGLVDTGGRPKPVAARFTIAAHQKVGA